MSEPGSEIKGPAYIAYAPVDRADGEWLSRTLESAGIPVWKDLLRPGADFSRTTEQAIEREAAVFIACFSTASLALEKSDLNEEILLAVEQSRLRSPGATWIMPVRFDECQLPAFRLGGGRMLSGIVSADLFGERKDANAARLIDSVRRGLGMPALSNSVLDALYRADQALVADSIIALKQGAVQMLGPQAGELDLLGYEGAQALGDRWDVLQNYAEVAFPKDHSYSREIIDASYDPAWRQALRDWAEQNPGLLASPVPPGIAAFDYAAALDLDRYLGEFSEPSAELTTALSAERLPCSPSLVTHSPELASAVMRIWRLTSADSPMRQTAAALSAQGATAQLTADDDPDAADAIQPETEIRQSDRPATAADDDRHDKSLTDSLGRLFRLPAADAERLRRESVSQRLGFVFRAEASLFSSACLVAYKELDSPPTLSDVLEQIAEADVVSDAEPLDHWILISPHQDPDSKLVQHVKHWNGKHKYPFTIQIWSPRSGIRELLAAEPEVYRRVYGQDISGLHDDPERVITEFAERLRPPARLPEKLAAYVASELSFVQAKEVSWLEQVRYEIERFGYDENGSRLHKPLKTEILSALFDSPGGSDVALLLAEFGEGKSFFTVSLCLKLRNSFLTQPAAEYPIPLRFFLRDYRHVSSSVEFLRTQLEQLGLDMTVWPDLIHRKVLIILDGLDEMSVRQDPETTRENLDKVGSLLELLEGCQVLVTSRPHFFASAPDREQFYDRLRRPHIFRLAQPDRRETVANLRAFASSPVLTAKLNKIKELYDPVGLAGKVLFLEMIKDTLPDLPEDRFDELVLYETYIDRALKRKIQLLSDPHYAMHNVDLRAELETLLEKIAIAIHLSGEGSVDLRQFVAESGGAAKLLWRAAASDDVQGVANADALARIGGRSLLRRVSGAEQKSDEGWVVDFFHRSMKEYFVAKALRRALQSPDPYSSIRATLINAPIQPEILGFFRLLARGLEGCATTLASLAHSALVGSGQGLLGGGAISLLCALGVDARESDWKSLDLDGALLAGADFSGSDLRQSSLRGADLAQIILTGADLREADLTDANLAPGGSAIAFTRDFIPGRYLCLTPEPGIGRIAVKPDGSLSFTFLTLPRSLRSPQGVFALAEDVLLITTQSDLLVVDIGSGAAEVAAHFRVSNEIRALAVIDQSLLGVALEPERGLCEAVLLDIETGQVQWAIPVSAHGRAFGWSSDGLLISYDNALVYYGSTEVPSRIATDAQPSGYQISVCGRDAVMVSGDGLVTRFRLDRAADAYCVPVHNGAGTAVLATGSEILSAGSDGTIAVLRPDAAGALTVAGRLQRRLQCAGAKVDGLRRDRERLLFLANGAKDAGSVAKV